MNDEQQQAEALLTKLQVLRREYSEYKSLWRYLGEACEMLESRIRVLIIAKDKAQLSDLSDDQDVNQS